jgi:hypothetical protein
MSAHRTLSFSVLLILALGASSAEAHGHDVRLGEPIIELIPASPMATGSGDAPDIDNWNRSAVVSLYYNHYLPSQSVPMNWTGSVAGCVAGTTSQAYIDATFQTINYYRTMVGLPDVTNNASLNDDCQEAALIMSANGALSHYPPSGWTCWSSIGYTAAGSSNLALGAAGPGAMTLYIMDPGTGNHFVGHRRWLLCPYKGAFGTGSVGETTGSANSLWVFGNTVSRPASPDTVPWPPEGYVPYQVVYPRWSFSFNSHPAANFAAANVTMTEGASPITLSVVSRTDNGYCDNTIVWEPSGINFVPGSDDRTFAVTITGISGGPSSSVSYDVVLIDPAVDTELIFDDGFESGGTGRWSSVVP